jgi:hypothetical protein
MSNSTGLSSMQALTPIICEPALWFIKPQYMSTAMLLELSKLLAVSPLQQLQILLNLLWLCFTEPLVGLRIAKQFKTVPLLCLSLMTQPSQGWLVARSDQLPFSDGIGSLERFCHIIRNFVDYLLDLTMSYVLVACIRKSSSPWEA